MQVRGANFGQSRQEAFCKAAQASKVVIIVILGHFSWLTQLVQNKSPNEISEPIFPPSLPILRRASHLETEYNG